jgi:hypothetical protein
MAAEVFLAVLLLLVVVVDLDFELDSADFALEAVGSDVFFLELREIGIFCSNTISVKSSYYRQEATGGIAAVINYSSEASKWDMHTRKNKRSKRVMMWIGDPFCGWRTGARTYRLCHSVTMK